MAIVVKIPTPLRKYSGGRRKVQIQLDPEPAVASVREVLYSLVAEQPEMKRALFSDEDALKPTVRVFVGEADIESRGGLNAEVRDNEVISIIPPVAGA